MVKLKTKSIFYPHYVVDSVLLITVDELRRIGVRHLVFDVDETLVHSRSSEVHEHKIQHIHRLRQAGIGILIGSNSPRDLSALAQSLQAMVVPSSYAVFKPRKKFYRRAIKLTGAPPHQIMMVGDRLLNDVVGANRAGLRTTMVRPVKRRPGLVFRWYSRSLRQV